jgi:ABC-type lipoprotein release transport system permease subunit
MPRLVLKALRDLVAMRVRAVLLVLVLAGGMSVLAGGFMARRSIYHTRDATYTELALADLEVNFKAASDDELPALDGLAGVAAVEKRFYQTGYLDLVPRATNGPARRAGQGAAAGRAAAAPASAPARAVTRSLPTVVIYARAGTAIDKLEILSGRGLSDDDVDGVVIEKSLAEYHEVAVGQELVLDPDRGARRFVVRGIGRSPEFLLPTANPETLIPGKGSLGVLYASAGALRRTFAEPLTNALLFTFAAGRAAEAEGQVRARLQPLKPERITRQHDSFAYRFLEEDLKGFDVYLPLAVVLIGVVTAIVAFLAFGRLIAAQRRQLAAVLALGYTPVRVFLAHLVAVGVLWLVATAVGVPLSHGLNVGLASTYAQAAGLPPVRAIFSWDLLAVGAAAALLLAAAAIVPPLLLLLRLSPSQALRGDAPPSYSRRRAALAVGPTAWRYGLRNLLRRPALTAATTTLIALAGAMAAAFTANVRSWERYVDREFSQQKFDAIVRYRAALSADEEARIYAAVPPQRREPAVDGFGLLDGKDYHFIGIPHRPPIRRLVFKEGGLFSADDAREIIINQSYTEKRRFALGQMVEVESGGRKVQLKVVGRLEDLTIGMAFVPIQTGRELFGVAPGKNTAALCYFGGPAAAEAARTELFKREDISWVNLLEEMRQAVNEYLADSLMLFARVIVGITTGLAVLFMLTALGMTLIEREGEYATLMSLGAPGGRIAAILGVEVLAQGLLASLLAVPLGYMLAEYLNHETAKAWMAIGLELEPGPFVRAIGPLLLFLPVGALPAFWRLMRLNLGLAVRSRAVG